MNKKTFTTTLPGKNINKKRNKPTSHLSNNLKVQFITTELKEQTEGFIIPNF